jgi:hypothetical protein
MTRVFILILALIAGPTFAEKPSSDLTNVRGFNYTTSLDTSIGPRGHSGLWLKYDDAQVERDLTNAQRLNLNQVLVFIAYNAWKADPELSNRNLLDFLHACQRHNIGVMLGLIDQPRPAAPGTDLPPELKTWLEGLAKLTAKEPALQFWDAANEPDNAARNGTDARTRALVIARATADLFRATGTHTPITIGCVHVACMEETAPAVDVLSFHDYSSTRAEIRANIAEAQAFAASVQKPVFNSEIACIGRANPYDMALEEFNRSHMGWYLWELTIVHEWGDVHGVFYPDGTVRDPSIVAAIMGFYRNRTTDTLLENPDREHWVQKAVTGGKAWLASTNPNWNEGLRKAEVEANILETAQLVAMREPPIRSVELLRGGPPNTPALQELVRRYIAILAPYQNEIPPVSPKWRMEGVLCLNDGYFLIATASKVGPAVG